MNKYKNTFKRILALSLTVVIMSSFAACQLFKSEDKETTKKVTTLDDLATAEGNKTEANTDYDGEKITGDAKSEIDDFNKKEEVLSQNGNSGSSGGSSSGGSKNSGSSGGSSSGSSSSGGSSSGGSSSSGSSSGGSSNLPKAVNFNKLNQEFFAKGIFTIEGTMYADMNGTTANLPFKLAITGDEKYVSAQYTQSGLTVGLLMNNEKTYLLLPTFKMYQEVGETMLGDADYSSLTDIKTYVSTKRVKIDNVIYVCEEVKSSDGLSTYFYFNEETGDLARIKFQEEDGESLLKVKSIKPTVNKDEFKVPSNYKKADLENMEDLG